MKDRVMATATLNPALRLVAIPLKELMPWAIFGGLLMFMMLYLICAEQGATSIFPGMYIHEFVHDGRHLIGFPCH
jgi:Probable cobalt transporter subunit (CbtB)